MLNDINSSVSSIIVFKLKKYADLNLLFLKNLVFQTFDNLTHYEMTHMVNQQMTVTDSKPYLPQLFIQFPDV